MHYINHIYKPLMKLKNQDILEYEVRNDYSHTNSNFILCRSIL
jgi:hypothetical protein